MKYQSFEIQLRDLRTYCAGPGLQLVHEYVDMGQSSTKDSRPELPRVMDDARKQNFDGIGVWRVDRFARARKRLLLADVGCGKGASTLLLANAFPKSKFYGFDDHGKSIEAAREYAKRDGIADRVSFEVAKAKEYPGTGCDFVAVFDCLHDMGDPVGAAAQVRRSLAKDGTWMIVEPFANDPLKDNLNPVGRVYDSFSTLLCTPCSRWQEVGLCLGAQAG